MRTRFPVVRGMLTFGILVALLIPISPQDKEEDEKIWAAFTAWIATNPKTVGLGSYEEKLLQDGVAKEEASRLIETIRRLLKDHPEKSIEVTYDRIFSKPLTGDAEKDGFTSTPSVFMMESTKELTPGPALDIGAGQGRNSVWLAQRGWEVTAVDISGAGLAAASANAERAGTSISTVKTTYQDFDYGIERWDLIVMILSWAPVSDPDFVTRLHAALRPGGTLVFEHVLLTDKQSFPAYVNGLPPNALLSHFKDFYIESYKEGVWPGDWGGPPAELVRAVVKKREVKAQDVASEITEVKTNTEIENRNISLVRRYVELLNARNYDGLTELLSPDYSVFSPSGHPEPSSREKLIENYMGASQAFSEFTWHIEDVMAAGDKVAARAIIKGVTQAGVPGLPKEATTFEFSMITIMRIKDGKIVEEWQEDDQLGFARQLGMVLKPEEKKR